jgi:hypothetical protein
MTGRDDDIEFDFFEDEPATSETQPRMRLPRRGASAAAAAPRSSLGPPRGPAPLLRLLVLVAAAIGVILLFAVLIDSCAGSSRKDSYANYMGRVQLIAAQSAANGKRLATVLTTSGVPVQRLETQIRSIAQQEQQNVNQARNLDPPGRLRAENGHLVDALALRVSGLVGLADAFKSTADSKNDEAALTTDAALLAAQASRLSASDVVWADLFRGLALAQFTTDGVEGVTVPESRAVSNTELLTEAGLKLVLQRIRASTGGDTSILHGTNIETVQAQPGNQTLTPGEQLNTVTATTELSFDVTVTDSGAAQEVGIPVTLTIDQGTGKPIVKTTKIDVIDPGESVTVSFEDLGEVQFARQTTVKVDVAPVTGEANKDNNSQQYKVIFTLP